MGYKMKNYVYTLVVIALIGGIISHLFSSFTKVKKYINFFVGLVAIICMLSPLTSLLNGVTGAKNSLKEYFSNVVNQEAIDSSNQIILNTGVESIKNGVKNTIINKFKFEENEVIVDIDVEKTTSSTITISEIKVTLTGKASWSDVDTVKAYLEDIIGTNISVKRK